MSLMFTANEITERNTALTYDDVLLMPRHCEITSRTIPNLETRLTKNKKICTDCQNYSVITNLKKFIPTIKPKSDPFYNSRIIKNEEEIAVDFDHALEVARQALQ